MKKVKLLGALVLLGIGFGGATIVNAWMNNNPNIYLSDENLRYTLVQQLKQDGVDVQRELPTAEQMQQYEGDTFSWEVGRSIEGIQYLPETVTKLEGSESETMDLSPIYDGYNEFANTLGMNHLKELSLGYGYVQDSLELESLMNLDNLETLTIIDSNKNFNDFVGGFRIYNENLTHIRYSARVEYPTQTIDKNQTEFSLKSPILLEMSLGYEDLDGTLMYTSTDKNFSVENDVLKWTLTPGRNEYFSFDWKYEYKENGKDFELKGHTRISLNKI